MFFALTGVCILHAPDYYIQEHTAQVICFTRLMLSVCSSGSVSLRTTHTFCSSAHIEVDGARNMIEYSKCS